MESNLKHIPNDNVWLWTLFATAMGAGVLYLPVNAGINGIWPLLAIFTITLPMVFWAHRNLSRVVLAASDDTTNINDIIFDNFSQKFCNLFALGYFLAIYPLILIYGVGLTNTISSILSEIFNVTSIPKFLISFIILAFLGFVVSNKAALVRKVTEYIALPLAGSLLLISIYLIPYWHMEYFQIIPNSFDFFETLWLTLPVMIFSFNYSAIISTFTLNYIRHHKSPEHATSKLLWRCSTVLFLFIMFFVVSCVLSVSPTDMELAKKENMNILVLMSTLFNDPLLHYINPLIAVIAMTGAFLGTFFGAREAVIGIIEQKMAIHKVHSRKLDRIAMAFIFVPAYIFCVLDTNILKVISILSGPTTALLLFLFPVYAFYKIDALNRFTIGYFNKFINYFTIIIGLMSFSAILYSFKYLFEYLK